MSISETPEPTAEVQRQLDMANFQLLKYARDLKRTVDSERQKAQELTLSHQQLQTYAKDLKNVFDAEKHKSQQLAEAHARLQILDRLKTDFLTFISHELRTALTPMAAVDIFDPNDDPQDQAQVIELVRRGYSRLGSLIDKGLEYFHWLGADHIETSESTDLAVVVRQVISNTPGLAEPGVDLQVLSPGIPCRVRGQEKHLAEVVQTLLDNALKFSGQDKWIRIELCAAEDKVSLRVADCGQGFAPELAPEIFQPFTIADVMHHSQGTGLNLALASARVQAYGGRMGAESQGAGKGTRFTVEFPACCRLQETAQE